MFAVADIITGMVADITTILELLLVKWRQHPYLKVHKGTVLDIRPRLPIRM